MTETNTLEPLELTWTPSAADGERFERMLGDTRKRAYSMALQLTRNPTDAEDLMQVTLLKAWRGFDGYQPGRPFLNWLLRIMQRAYLDSRRRGNPVRNAESLHSMVSPHDGDVQEIPIPDDSPGPDGLLMRSELAEAVTAALRELPEVYRAAIEMCDLQDMSYAEIADVQGTTIGTVRSRIHRGRRMLRDLAIQRGIGPIR
ncbi:MAG: sigma-70 family RNA polymerase sigma factor [Fimbriimonadaceae bacterium]|nr:sigma-70 family RNA polymerase sigma factor [Fimbriimonadaceae bacterium]